MNSLLHFLFYSPLWAALAAWLVCQCTKGVISRFRNHRWDLRDFLGSGGMPSSHTATVVALAYMVAVREGLESSAFSISVIFAFIVMYDAVGVRRETGKQSQIINLIVNIITGRTDGEEYEKLNEIVGHTPFEVMGGVIAGILVGFLWSLIPVP